MNRMYGEIKSNETGMDESAWRRGHKVIAWMTQKAKVGTTKQLVGGISQIPVVDQEAP